MQRARRELAAGVCLATAVLLQACFDRGQSPPSLRLGSVTHAFDSNQRFNELSFARTTGGLNVDAPASPNLAPPGHYMLFVLNSKDVPSTARIIRIK